MKILITGIDGFIGREVANKLKDAGHTVLGVSRDKKTSRNPDIYSCDILDRITCEEIFLKEKPEACIHLAGSAHTEIGPWNEKENYQVNVNGTMNVAKAAVKSGTKRFIYFSSAKVYGEETDYLGCDEEDQPEPTSVYAKNKFEAESRLFELNRENDFDLIVVRPVAVFGPGDINSNYARLIKAVSKGLFPIIDEGNARRSIAYMPRVAERVMRIVDTNSHSSQIYAFSDGTFQVVDIMNTIRNTTGFAIFPRIPIWLVNAGIYVTGKGFKVVGRKTNPLNCLVNRISKNFVIRTHCYDNDFGALPDFDLNSAISETCKNMYKIEDRSSF